MVSKWVVGAKSIPVSSTSIKLFGFLSMGYHVLGVWEFEVAFLISLQIYSNQGNITTSGRETSISCTLTRLVHASSIKNTKII